MVNVANYLAVDPLSLILSYEAYILLTLPDPPPIEVLNKQMKQVAAQLKGNQRKQALARARMLGAYAGAMERALSSGSNKSR